MRRTDVQGSAGTCRGLRTRARAGEAGCVPSTSDGVGWPLQDGSQEPGRRVCVSDEGMGPTVLAPRKKISASKNVGVEGQGQQGGQVKVPFLGSVSPVVSPP